MTSRLTTTEEKNKSVKFFPMRANRQKKKKHTLTSFLLPSCGFPFSSTGFMITQYCLLLRVVMRTIPTTSSCTPGMWVSVSLNLISHSSPFFLVTFLESVNVLNAFKCRAFYKTKLNVTVYDNITPIIFVILLIIHVVSDSLKAKNLQQTINIFNQ